MGYRNIKKQKNLFLFFKLRISIFQCPGTTHITNFTIMPQLCNIYFLSWWRNIPRFHLVGQLTSAHGWASWLQLKLSVIPISESARLGPCWEILEIIIFPVFLFPGGCSSIREVLFGNKLVLCVLLSRDIMVAQYVF